MRDVGLEVDSVAGLQEMLLRADSECHLSFQNVKEFGPLVLVRVDPLAHGLKLSPIGVELLMLCTKIQIFEGIRI